MLKTILLLILTYPTPWTICCSISLKTPSSNTTTSLEYKQTQDLVKFPIRNQQNAYYYSVYWGRERVSYSLDSTGKNELPKCAEEGKDATFCEQRDNVSQKFHIQAILPFLSQTVGPTESNLQTVYKKCWSESHHQRQSAKQKKITVW